jgi:hypothetical protein
VTHVAPPPVSRLGTTGAVQAKALGPAPHQTDAASTTGTTP